jgi:ribonucleoside-diphosphate reductase alpha chain
VQPFVSGSISKTVNMPAEATVEDIEDAYIRAWELGLKCVAIYRDGSKGSQAVSTSDDSEEETTEDEAQNEFVEDIPEIEDNGEEHPPDVSEVFTKREKKTSPLPHEFESATRRKVPEEAESVRKKFRVDTVEGYIHVGLFSDGTPGEIFVNITKAKPTISGLIDQWAIALSIGLQYGVPLAKYVEKFKNVSFKPSGFTGGDEVCKVAQSVVDYVARYLEHRFVDAPAPPTPTEMEEFQAAMAEAPIGEEPDSDRTGTPCPDCGTAMVQNGTCEVCPQCGETTGCG